MSRYFSTRRRVAVLSCALVMLSLATMIASIDTRPAGVRGREWALAHKSELPTTLSGLAPYTAAYRMAAFREASPEVRSALVKEHIALFEARYRLTAEQRQVLDDAAPLLMPNAYLDGGNSA